MTFFCYISFQHQQKVAVLGAAGGIGQPMSLLMKESPTISHLALYDIVNTPGRQFKPAFCRKSSVISTGMMRNTETELFENFIETLRKKISFFPKWICLDLGGGGLYEGSRKVCKQSPSPHFKYPACWGYIFAVWGGVRQVASADNHSIFYCACVKFITRFTSKINCQVCRQMARVSWE